MERDEERLDRLFAAYKEACPAPEASANFMPAVWAKIDARRGFSLALRRWTGAFVTAAAALCLAMVVYMASPGAADAPYYSSTYDEALSESGSFETLAYSEMVEFEVVNTSLGE